MLSESADRNTYYEFMILPAMISIGRCLPDLRVLVEIEAHLLRADGGLHIAGLAGAGKPGAVL